MMQALPRAASILLLAAAPLLAQQVPPAQPAPESDPRVAWLAKHAAPIRSLDLSDGDFRDLEPLRAALRGTRVVLLGEHPHDDGTTFLAKARLVRFLHEQMGFNVLAFESGLYDCPKAWEALVKGEEPRKALTRGVFAIWSESREVQPLFDYIGAQWKGGHPLEVAGVDSQTTGSAAVDDLVPDLAAYLSRLDPKLSEGEEWTRASRIIGQLNQGGWEMGETPVPPASEQAAFAQTIERWRSLIAERDRTPATRPWSGSFWRQLLASLRAFAEQEWRTDYSDLKKFVENSPIAVYNMRDVQMGKNLLWLAEKRYPKEKIIVWAASAHNARALSTVKTSDPKYARLFAGWTPMGEVAWKKLGNELYAIGFISQEGEAARYATKKATTVPPSSRDSLEDLFTRASLENAFVDLRHPGAGGAWLHAPLTARPLFWIEMQADWTRVMDGVVFIRKVERVHKRE
jgi:erythromycin esterase